MVDLSQTDEQDLKGRISDIFSKIDALLKEIGPKLREVGILREEAGQIYAEMHRRGLVVQLDGEEPIVEGQVQKA